MIIALICIMNFEILRELHELCTLYMILNCRAQICSSVVCASNLQKLSYDDINMHILYQQEFVAFSYYIVINGGVHKFSCHASQSMRTVLVKITAF